MTQTTNRRRLAAYVCACAAALTLWACKEDNPRPDPPTVSLSMAGATGQTDNVSVGRAEGTGELQWPDGKTLGRTFTVALSAATTEEVTVALELLRSENVPAGSVALSPQVVRIAAGQTSGTATVSVTDEAFLAAGGTFELGVRTGATTGTAPLAQPLEAKVVATVASFSPDISMVVSGIESGTTDSFTATRSPETDCAVSLQESKSLNRVVSLRLSAAATADVSVSLVLTMEGYTEGQVSLSETTVRIAAGQTLAQTQVNVPSTDFMAAETQEKTYSWTVAVTAVEGITPPATLPQATVAVTVPACEKRVEPSCDKTEVKIAYTVAGVSSATTVETQCVEVTVDASNNTYTFKSLKIRDITKDWTVTWEDGDEESGGGYLFGDCGDSDYADSDNCWRYSITGREKPTVADGKVTKFKATIGEFQTTDPDDLDAQDEPIGTISIGE